MPIMFQKGGNFWIERHSMAVICAAAVGEYTSATVNLDRAGTVMSWSVTGSDVSTSNTVRDELGMIILLSGSGIITIGAQLSDIRVQVSKPDTVADTATITFEVIVYMRKTGGR